MKSIFLTTMLIATAISNKEAHAPQMTHHLVTPDGTNTSLEKYRRLRQDLVLNFKNHNHPIRLIKITNSALIVSYENGIVVMGFNHAKGQPTSQLSVYEGQFDLSPLASSSFEPKSFDIRSLGNIDKAYASTDVSIAQDNDNQIYIGKLKEQKGSESFTARVSFNKTLMTGSMSQLNIESATCN